MNQISFVRYSPHASEKELTTQVVECYRQVFADEPWHEWLQCPVCKEHWGITRRELLQSWSFRHCGADLVDFWTKDRVATDLLHEITPEASCWIALRGEQVIGFCWGYPITIEDLELKLGIRLEGLPPQCSRSTRIAYQDELGVVGEYRGAKLAKQLFVRRLEDFCAQGLEYGVVRTRRAPEPSVTYLWFTEKLGYKVIGEYPVTDGRVVLGRTLIGLEQVLQET